MARATASTTPTLRRERALMRERGVSLLACVDEVGRGALSGPVTLGVVVISLDTPSAPTGVRDSKLLTPARRAHLAPRIKRWALDHAVGHASAAEIDEFGIMAALRMAGTRALGQLVVRPELVLLDGNHDYLSPPVQEGLFGEPERSGALPPVVTMIKGDMRCSGVASASVLAKLSRDAIMLAMSADFPDYGWEENKGYSAHAHIEALRRLGPCVEHRRSWRLPTGELVGAAVGGTHTQSPVAG